MRYEITIEEQVPIRREFTVEVPDEEDDPAEYLRTHPKLWHNPQLPPTAQDIARLRPASPPTFLDAQQQVILEWVTYGEERHRTAVSVAELRRALWDGHGEEPLPFSTVLDVTAVIVGHAGTTHLNQWLSHLETGGRTRINCATHRIVEPATLRPHNEHPAGHDSTEGISL